MEVSQPSIYPQVPTMLILLFSAKTLKMEISKNLISSELIPLEVNKWFMDVE